MAGEDVTPLLVRELERTATALLAQIAGEKAVPSASGAGTPDDEIVVVQSIAEKPPLSLVMEISVPLARTIAAAMLARPVPRMDGLARDAAAEFASTVTGNAAGALAEHGFRLRPSAPTCLAGGSLPAFTPVGRATLACPSGTLRISISQTQPGLAGAPR